MVRNILYVGGFILPDKNAAAQRVMGNAKVFKMLGHNVFFLNYSDSPDKGWVNYNGFDCLNLPKRSMLKQLVSVGDILKAIDNLPITDVITYNYPAFALNRIIGFCKHNGIRCIADVTEWYASQRNLFYRIIKNADTWWRMEKLHFQMDGIIAISEYLYQYYNKRMLTVKIPPLTDVSVLPKHNISDSEKTVFLYAGSPDAQKERLDLIVDAVTALSSRKKIEFRVIGITEKQYKRLYKKDVETNNIRFLGRIDHAMVLEEYKRADWSIVLRDDNSVVKAGFPTKVSESISCGVPVVANKFSNITDYLNSGNSLICDISQISKTLEDASEKHLEVDNAVFDYRRYADEMLKLFV